MSRQNAGCAVCGENLVYIEESQPLKCQLCGKEEPANSACAHGHYVCNSCHRENGIDFIMDFCKASSSRDPIEIAQTIMADKSIYPNGPEHHSMVGAALLTAYRNSGGDIDLESALDELRMRSMQVPGGTCGYWGVCGAAVSAGQFYSIANGSTPLAADPWERTAKLTGRIINRIADIGGPRCCKRTSFTAIRETVDYVYEVDGVKMELPSEIVCSFMAGNAECKRRDCPYFPGS